MGKLTHGDLIQLGTLLGYPTFEKGVCRGFSAMWAQAVLANQQKSFFARLDFISFYKPFFKQLKNEITAAKQTVRKGLPLDAHSKKVLEVLAFLDGISLYHSPHDHRDVFDRYLSQHDLTFIYPLTKSDKLARTDLYILLNKLYVFNKKNLSTYLLDLANILNKVSIDFPILLSNSEHCVGLKYNKATRTWQYIDTNDFEKFSQEPSYFRKLTTEELVENIFSALGMNNVYVLLNITVLASNHCSSSLKAAFSKLDTHYPIQPQQASVYDRRDTGLLFLACRNGNLAVVKSLLREIEVDINHSSREGFSPLHIASYNNRLNIVQLMLRQRRIKINQTNKHGQTPLHIACTLGHSKLVKAFLSHSDINVNATAEAGLTPLHMACYSNYFKTVKALVGQPDINLNALNNDGETPLYTACKQGHAHIVDLLLQQPNIDVNAPDLFGFSPLHLACMNNNFLIVEMLLSHSNIDVNYAVINGLTPLFYACYAENLKIVQLMLQHPKVDVSVSGHYGTALHLACQRNNLSLVEALLKHPKININTQNSTGMTALFIACKNNAYTIMERLLNKRGIAVNLPSKEGETPLYSACANRQLSIVKALLSHPCIKVNQKNNKQLTPLLIAVKYGHLDIVELLLEKATIDVNLADQSLNTPLHYACINGDLRIVQALLTNWRINVNQADHEGKTAFAIACSKGYIDITVSLLNASVVNIAQKNVKGNTPLHLACISPSTEGKAQLFQLLLYHGSDLMEKNIAGFTALDLAIIQNNKTAISTIVAFAKRQAIDMSSIISSIALKHIKAYPYDFKEFPEIRSSQAIKILPGTAPDLGRPPKINFFNNRLEKPVSGGGWPDLQPRSAVK